MTYVLTHSFGTERLSGAELQERLAHLNNAVALGYEFDFRIETVDPEPIRQRDPGDETDAD